MISIHTRSTSFLLSLLLLGAPVSSVCFAQNTATNSSPPASPPAVAPSTTPAAAPIDNSPPTLQKAAQLYGQGKSDEALGMVNTLLQAQPQSINAYILRGAIYSQKKNWDLAQKDYETVLQMDPKNDGVHFDLADLKFKQKQFDAAREAFVPLQGFADSDVKDLVNYKIFLCDLFGGHDDLASQELAVFNQLGSNASYYFGNAAWDLVHKKPEEARGWLISASNIYAGRKQLLYASVLKDMGYLPLPPAPDAP